MKRILLVCSLFVAASTAVFAQATPSHPAPPVVSKTEFTAKVNELDALIALDNKTAADAKYHEISQLVNNEMIVLRYKMQDAMDAHNDADKTHYIELSKSQRMLNAQVMQLKNDWGTNRAVIKQKLSTFAESII